MYRLDFDLTDSQKKIVRAITKNDGEVWVVGGAVRDKILGLEPKDIDLVTDLRPVKVRASMAGEFHLIPDTVAWNHGICRVNTPEGIVDVATMRKDTWTDGRHVKIEYTDEILEDLARRDFTINAMAQRIDEQGRSSAGADIYNGEEHLEAKVVRFVGNPSERIQEDWLRMLRACRFTALGEGWQLDTDALEWIAEWNHEIPLVSKERIRDEILKALSYPKPSNFFRALYDTGLLRFVAPHLYGCVGIEQNEYHDEEVFDHLMYCVDAAAEETDNVLLRMAALLHDVGKARTKSTDSNGGVHFFKHEMAGAIHTGTWMEDYRFSKKEIRYVTKLIRHHQWRFMDDSKDKTIKKWLREVGEEWYDLITLRMADRKGNMAKQHKPAMTKKMRELIEWVERIKESGEPIFDGDLAINGNDLEDIGIRPGSAYKQIFQEIWALVLNEPSKNTKEQLTDFVQKGRVRGRF